MLIGPVAVRANRVAPPRGPQVSMNTCQRRLLQLTHHDEESRNGSTVRQRRLWPRGEAVRSYKRARVLRITSRPALLLKADAACATPQFDQRGVPKPSPTSTQPDCHACD